MKKMKEEKTERIAPLLNQVSYSSKRKQTMSFFLLAKKVLVLTKHDEVCFYGKMIHNGNVKQRYYNPKMIPI